LDAPLKPESHGQNQKFGKQLPEDHTALSPEAIAHFTAKATKKVRTKQARLVQWDEIKDNPPKELKILPIAAIPHKSKDFCSILDLSFCL
jgi:hypothetical protein